MINAGFIQFAPVLGEPGENISQLEKLIADAAGADLIVLPELANTGYNFESRSQAKDLAEDLSNSPYLEFLTGQSRKHDLFIVSGMAEIDSGKLYNTAILVGGNGLIGKYRKIHLFMNEFDFFEKGGAGLTVFDIGIARIGILICFDWVFPEVWRILAIKGAEVICHPSNLVLPYAQQAVPVYGMVNRTFNITANRYGTERGVTFTGQSFISGPSGEVITMAGKDEDEVRITGLDMDRARDKMITPRNHLWNDRTVQEYKDLL